VRDGQGEFILESRLTNAEVLNMCSGGLFPFSAVRTVIFQVRRKCQDLRRVKAWMPIGGPKLSSRISSMP
jgi:hypothetical protein